jgi:RNA polymerase sigma factor (sigma-70 family)
MHAPAPKAKAGPAAKGHQWLFELACPGPVDRPHRANFYLLSCWVQNYWGRWSHARKGFADLRWNGKVHCSPDATWDTTVAIGLDEVRCRHLDYQLPKIFFKKPVLGFFLLWLLAMLGLGPVWEDRPPKPQRKKILKFRGGEAPFHHIARPNEAEERRLFKLAKGGDIIARNMIIAGHLRLAEEIAGEFHVKPNGVFDIDDIRQDAAEALFKAVDDFNHESGNRFWTFAEKSVRRDVQDVLRKMRRLGRHPSTEEIAKRNEHALGLYARNSVEPKTEAKIFRRLFEKT